MSIVNRLFKKESSTIYISKHIFAITGVILIWRGTWYTLDYLDKILLGGSHAWTSIAGIIIGVLILYLPDKDLKELVKTG